jgi:membrane-associated phospholipid phosphatase
VATLMPLALRTWELASAMLFTYIAILAVTRRGLRPGARMRALAGSAVGILVTAASAWAHPDAFLHGWLLPPILLLLGYWMSGLLFVAPMPRAERTLQAIDRALAVRWWSANVPRWVAELLELAYGGIYVVIPLALALHLTVTPFPDSDRFWTVVLVTDYVCFAVLPWIQTRPPRVLESGEPWRASFRSMNVRLLGAASIQVNTFPSGHAAEALAAALLVWDAPTVVVTWMMMCALAVSAGAVLGRYHYAADAVAGWIVAIVVWMLV